MIVDVIKLYRTPSIYSVSSRIDIFVESTRKIADSSCMPSIRDSCYSNALAYLPALISAVDEFNGNHICLAPNVRM